MLVCYIHFVFLLCRMYCWCRWVQSIYDEILGARVWNDSTTRIDAEWMKINNSGDSLNILLCVYLRYCEDVYCICFGWLLILWAHINLEMSFDAIENWSGSCVIVHISTVTILPGKFDRSHHFNHLLDIFLDENK